MLRGLRGDLALAALASTLGGACGGPATVPADCPDDALSTCPTPAPTFAADAAPVIAAHCAKCHVPGGQSSQFPFETYAQIAPFAGDINLQLQTCQMPKPPEAPLSLADRKTLFGWIACGALDD